MKKWKVVLHKETSNSNQVTSKAGSLTVKFRFTTPGQETKAECLSHRLYPFNILIFYKSDQFLACETLRKKVFGIGKALVNEKDDFFFFCMSNI